MKNFIYILMFMATVVWSLESTISAHVKITNLDGDVLYDTVMVVDYYDYLLIHLDCYKIDESDESIDFVEYFSRVLEIDYKDKSFYIEFKEKSDSEFRLFYVTSYMNGKKHGIEKHYYESGQLKIEMSFVNDKRHGIEKDYYESGQLKIETPYINGEAHGIVKQYYESGQLKIEMPFVNGEAHGIGKVYYESGQLWGETPCVNGKRHGIEKHYYKSGQLEIKTPYVNDKRHGIRKEYNNKGKVISTAKYKNGMLVGYKRCSDGRFGNEELKCQ